MKNLRDLKDLTIHEVQPISDEYAALPAQDGRRCLHSERAACVRLYESVRVVRLPPLYPVMRPIPLSFLNMKCLLWLYTHM
jgi:hypothetical protein